jgi:hypothetical protein
LWALDKNELKIDNQMKRIIEEKSKDKQSIYHIIYTKLNYSKNLIEILNDELKKYKTLMASVKNIDQYIYKYISTVNIENTVKQVLDLNSALEEVKKSISDEEKTENSKVANQVICEFKDILISETKLNSENDSLNKSCDSSHSSDTSFSTPEPESKKRRYSLRSRSKDTSSIGSFQYLNPSSDSFDSSEKKTALQQRSDEKKSRKQPKRKVKSNRKLFPDYYFN